MGRIIYSDGRTALTTTAFRYKLTDSTGTLVKDWTTGATWTEEPAGTYYLDDAAAVPGTRYAVEPATGQVGGAGMVPEPMRGTDGANTVAPDNATIAAAAASAASADGKATTLLARNNALTAGETRTALGMAAADLDAQMDAIAGAVAALPTAPVGTRIDQTTCLDAQGNIDPAGTELGLNTPGSSITAYLASDTERTYPKRHTTAASDGTWALYLPAGTYVLVAALDGYYDAADGDSVIERTVVVP